LYNAAPQLDDEGRLRADRKELDPAIQAAVAQLWERINTDTLHQLSDFAGYKREFLQLFGFEVDGVDYDADVNPDVAIAQMV
jgi:enoyl-[acyl-carrier protein] reductase/trans-2-enoyl-CoA reductase (NAD+)